MAPAVHQGVQNRSARIGSVILCRECPLNFSRDKDHVISVLASRREDSLATIDPFSDEVPITAFIPLHRIGADERLGWIFLAAPPPVPKAVDTAYADAHSEVEVHPLNAAVHPDIDHIREVSTGI